MQSVSEFFTLASLFALGGASIVALVVTNTLRKVFGWNPIIVCFVTSLAVCYLGAYELGKLSGLAGLLLPFANACLLFCTTTGMQEFAGAATTGVPTGTAAPHGRKQVDVTTSWLR